MLVIFVYGYIGAMILRIITLSITTFSIMDLTVTLCINDTRYSDTLHNH
jgi:hypothetical protein